MKPTLQKRLNAVFVTLKAYTKTDTRIRDDCRINGNYRGSGHQNCNLKLRINAKELKIPVIFHTLRGYDRYFIMQEIGGIAKNIPSLIKEVKSSKWIFMLFLIMWKNIWLSCLENILYFSTVFNS